MSDRKEDDKLAAIQVEIENTKGVMKSNIEKTINRGEKLEALEDKADTLNNRAKTFQSTARAARRQFCWQNYKYALIIFFVIVLIIVIIVLSVKK